MSAVDVTRELWAFCGVCSRWFFVERSENPEATQISCPVCSVPSAIFRNRVQAAKHRVTRSATPGS